MLRFFDGCDSGDTYKFYNLSGSTVWVDGEGLYGGGAIYVPHNTSAAASGFEIRFFDPAQLGIAGGDISGRQTLSFWVRASEPITSLTPDEWIIPNTQGPNAAISNFAALLSPGSSTDMKIFYNSETSTQAFSYSLYPYSIWDGNWHHLMISYEYVSSSSTYTTFYGWLDDKKFYQERRTWTYFGDNGDNNVIKRLFVDNIRTSTPGGIYFDDIMIWDDTDNGDGFHTLYMPPQRIMTLRPSADTAQADSSPSTGSDRYAVVNDIQPNGSFDYVTFEPGGVDIYDLEDIEFLGNANFISVNWSSSSNDVAYWANTRPFIVSNGVRSNGNTYSTATTTYGYNSGNYITDEYLGYIVVRDPGNSNVAWSNDNIDLLQVGFENIGP